MNREPSLHVSEYWFAQALHCRRLAQLAHDPRLEAMLALTATDFEKRANALIAEPIPPIEPKLSLVPKGSAEGHRSPVATSATGP